jgi:hypothetical protein
MHMNFTFNFVASLVPAVLALSLSSPLWAQDLSASDMEKKVEALQAEVQALKAQGAAPERLREIERRIDLLAQEIEVMRTGGAAETETSRQGVYGLGPAASKVYRRDKGVSLGGYGEAVFRGGDEPTLDALRSVLYVGYKFSDRILFNSEVEFEHATTGEGAEEKGEVSVELAYLDFKPWKSVGVRAGMVLMPVGFLNEIHEPPVFLGVFRPTVESVILPTTWREVGAGLFGETGSVSWRGYVVAGLDSAGFAAGNGIRGGRQGGSQSKASDVAFTGRADFTGVPGLLAGASIFTGNSGQGASIDGTTLEGSVTVFDLHAQYERRGLSLRALYARTSIDDAALINAQNGLSPEGGSVGERQYGFYLQAGYDVLNGRQGRWAAIPFLRYERLDTQDRVPAGYQASPKTDRTIWTAGLSVKPLFNVVLKADYQWEKSAADTKNNRLNLGVGYLF